MSIKVAIRHHTKYIYDKAIQVYPQVIRLRPAPHTRSDVVAYSLNIQPSNHFINWQQDPFGNFLARVSFPEPTTEFIVDVEVIANLVTINPFDFFLEDYAERFPFVYNEQLQKELLPYLEIKEAGPKLKKWLEEAQIYKDDETINFLVHLNQKLCNDINYTVRLKPGVQSCEETLGLELGSCRDSAWLFVQILRHFGLAARFVSGYLVQLKADDKVVDGPSGPEEDFTDLHAWAEVYLPGAGWVGLDATSGLFAGEGHIPLACTPDPGSAAPITGFTAPTQVQFEFKNIVERIEETPRVTKPYTEEQWETILALGDQVEEVLQQEEVKLSMGGEPTFVSALDMESEQWNEEADGKDKREMAFELTEKLKAHFAPKGFLHLGQGKWYPGEPIPRWQNAIYWRIDGGTLWSDPKLLANPNQDYGFDETHAATFMNRLAFYLGVNDEHVSAAYEDVFYFLWEEGNLPLNIDPLKIDPKDKLERQTLAALLDKGLNRPAGYVLPMKWEDQLQQWQSCPWQFKRKELFLIPGNSAMGLRLPLDRLLYLLPEDTETVVEASPMEDLPDLSSVEALATRQANRAGQHNSIPPTITDPSDSSEGFQPVYRAKTIRTALCIEAREGKLHLFIPPIKDMEAYIDLLYTIEKVATELALPIIMEGYHPPSDNRLQKLVVAPDPGVIEVNVHPATSWREIVHNYDLLFDLAKNARLGAEKFMLDGKHTGTGGGNHITIGGLTPAESPLLRRPDLLRSFVNFWQNHPGLSYLFSSAFVGPTSQAPRVDEGRKGMLFELEIAFAELDRHENPAPWLVDRIFRNLLIDITGNTHRAEFCIDKLYSPDSSSGRLGILEMRGFDMPPHKQMCLMQLLLIRALVAAFWKQPYRQKLIRWGTSLHDKFLIHHFVKEDLGDVLFYLREAGFDFDMAWFEPFFEFRFPLIGQIHVDSIELSIRAGIEPWNVLGEEMSNTGTARFVDSSVERIEVALKGINIERYQLLCNQTIVPLTFTGTKGSYVAGIRYKAWSPPSALHPTIEADIPLVFDIYDTWNKRSIGGCTYHVSHPGGRSYETFPVNSFEAESRRVNRFWEYNHTARSVENVVGQGTVESTTNRFVSTDYVIPEKIKTQKIEVDKDFPYTLDLRKARK